MSFVVVDKLRVRYGKFTAVHDVSFEIPKGELFGFIGPNGAGKSTTIKVLATLIKPGSGRALVDGIDVAKAPGEVRRRIGYVPDFFGVYEDLSVREYLHFFAAAYRIDIGKRAGLVKDVLALTDLSEKEDAPVDGLSRGMKQRLSISRVLLHDPELLLLDEPASGLDPRARIEMRELLKELQRLGKTIIISSHILHELAQLCTRIGIIEQGRMVAEGPLDEIFRRLRLLRLVHVQVANPSEALLAGMRALPGVAAVEAGPDRMEVQLREGDVSIEDLHDGIAALGARIRMFQAEALDMETAFMKLTEGKTA
ncbi:MAG TPA: ABC transporter ATP-binding protein [Planctomycetota bacterium]|nr:ABC transporter ATP-binding protein [Planctomycetota bacterium]